MNKLNTAKGVDFSNASWQSEYSSILSKLIVYLVDLLAFYVLVIRELYF